MSEKKTSIVVKGVDKASPAFRGISSSLDGLKNKVKSFESRMALFNEQNKTLNKRLTSIGSKASTVGKVLSVGVTAPVVAAGLASVKAFADFDHGLRMTLNNLDETSFGAIGLKQGFSNMRKELLDLAKISPASLDSLNKALFDTVSAGIPAAGAMKVVASANKLAVAGATDVAIATDGMTSALNGFKISAEKAEVTSAKFFVAQKFGKTTIEELAKDIGKVAPLASAMGVSFEEVLSAVSAATLAGIKTNESYTAMKAVLANVVKPTDDAKKAAKALGIQFDSNALKSKGFAVFMADILKNAKRIGVEPSLAFEKLFGSVEALNFASAVGGKQFESFKNILSELNNETKLSTDFQKAYELQNASFTNRLEILKNKFMVMGVTIGEKLEPFIVSLSGKIEWLLNFLESNPGIAKFAGGLALVGAVMGPVLVALGGLLTALPGIIVLAKALGITTIGAMAPFLLWPLAIGAVIGVGVLLVKNWDLVKEKMASIWSSITDIFSNSIKKLSSVMPPFLTKMFTGSPNIGVTQTTESTSKNLFAPPRNLFGADAAVPTVANSVTEKKSSVDIRILSAPGVKAKVSADSSDDDLNINTGFQGAASF